MDKGLVGGLKRFNGVDLDFGLDLGFHRESRSRSEWARKCEMGIKEKGKQWR